MELNPKNLQLCCWPLTYVDSNTPVSFKSSFAIFLKHSSSHQTQCIFSSCENTCSCINSRLEINNSSAATVKTKKEHGCFCSFLLCNHLEISFVLKVKSIELKVNCKVQYFCFENTIKKAFSKIYNILYWIYIKTLKFKCIFLCVAFKFKSTK